MVRGVGAAGHVIKEKRLVGRSRVQIPHVPDGVIRQVSGEVVAGLAHPWKHLGRIAEQVGRPLIGLTTHEAIEILKPHADRPLIEGPNRAVLIGGCVMVLAKPGSSVAVLLEDLAHGGALRTDDGVIARVAVDISPITPKPTE